MKLPATIFREYDIRGTVGDELTGEVAYAIGKAFATLATERLGRAARIAVGRDNRPSGVDLANQVVSGIVDAGSDRKSTRLNSSHLVISYAVFCLKKKDDVGSAPAEADDEP